MSHHFEAGADSSDDDAFVDMSTWTNSRNKSKASGSANARFVASEALMMSGGLPVDEAQKVLSSGDGSNNASEHDSGNEPVANEEMEVLPQRDSPPRIFSRFTSINRPAASAQPMPAFARPSFFDEDEVEGHFLEDDIIKDVDDILAHVSAQSTHMLVPIIEEYQRTDESIEDFTQDRIVRHVLEEIAPGNITKIYSVEFWDGEIEETTIDRLLQHINGHTAFNIFKSKSVSSHDGRERTMSLSRPERRQKREIGFVNALDVVSDDEPSRERRTTRSRKNKPAQIDYTGDEQQVDGGDEDGSDRSDSVFEQTPRYPGRRSLRQKSRRNLTQRELAEDLQDLQDDSESSDKFLLSDIPGTRKRKRTLRTRGQKVDDFIRDDVSLDRAEPNYVAGRQSGRSTRHQGNMQEFGVEEIYLADTDSEVRERAKPKTSGAKESFKILPRNDEFRMRHSQNCDTCGQSGNFAPLICCQGCTLVYHKSCLGHRSNRDHLVTKVADDDFVLQCRRCVAWARKKEPTAPNQGKCQDCQELGQACEPFRPRKTAAQEQKEREENGGIDPDYEVQPSRLNNADNVLFRCMQCFRGFHFEHLPSRSDVLDLEIDAEQRFREYSRDWKCKECFNMPAKVSKIIAWKPVDEDNYDPDFSFEAIDEDEKIYLVKWDGMSYFRASWMPGAWVWGVTSHLTRKAFAKKFQGPVVRTEDAIPEDFLRTDIVLDVKFTSIVDIRTEEVDKARIREVDKALIKYKGLGYEDAVWEAPPSPEDGYRWTDFVTAYNDWVLGRYVRQPKQVSLRSRLERARKESFASLEKKSQPDNLSGGELMKYQLEGVNWLYYKWFMQKNAILADEMGLGKTIQIIGFLATLVQDWNCFPFLVVVPNSTCPNWRREIKNWAPSLRVVAYYGSKESRDLAFKHELFPGGSKDLRCHVVVTSYDAAADENCRKFLRSVPWQGLIVDEGQRLKNDKNQLYAALGALKVPFKILLTGTPLQNNQRELFNLLHFLDDTYNAEQLEEEFQELDQGKITQLHDMIRPFFLRRTKAQVLTFLPPMSQIIVPISMTLVQKKLYRTILAKNHELIRSIFSSGGSVKKDEGASLNNILMQLRKCLCHPFVYSKSIEEVGVSQSATHRNLVEASSKLMLLELLLPKLKERGHRVLIFSQFLDMLDIIEDFMDGCGLTYQRLDGSISSLQKQKRIDEFNAEGSELFAFLLSTRAGGVGINLVTADTVIILDPDFNPHQDIQALSRAHRIGQKKKVLCFQLVTRPTAEERIMQIGRKKLALDHVLIQEMSGDDNEQVDLVSILRHGASEIFEDSGETDIIYDGPAVDRLLDRGHMEDIQAGQDKSAESTFSFARVWANDENVLQDADTFLHEPEANAPDAGVWANILKERERLAAEEAVRNAEAFGRGQRARGKIGYATDEVLDSTDGIDITAVKKKKKKNKDGSESDTDFQAEESDYDDDETVSGEDPQAALGADDSLGDITGAKERTGPAKNSKSTPNMRFTAPSTPRKAIVKKQIPWVTIPKPPKKTPKKAVQASAPPTKKPGKSLLKVVGRGSGQSAVQLVDQGNPKHLHKSNTSAKRKRERIETIDLTIGHESTEPDVDRHPSFRRVPYPPPRSTEYITYPQYQGPSFLAPSAAELNCMACHTVHAMGSCPAKIAGVEYCNLCGMAHYGFGRVCPHIQSETQVRAMLEALKHSKEPEHLVAEARRYLRGLKGNLVQMKKQKALRESAMRAPAGQLLSQSQPNGYGLHPSGF
ncbi:SNF2 family DNA-dependent chromodomain-containing ATPase [Acrodontium crateriforme]|uniref:SNF2 family DNA-dependent chromodomain-containing ATPase n=1 Tax=Acrodontium crateriforme TaxID=150365 RepID=A0AAQ3RAQ0_9PEZI|nr:SNF2 family DNA-dependent chromodomain-containing ATPase [Acrodontium crateriforme]